MVEPGRGKAGADWWKNLSAAWRANIGLYGLATIALVALLAQIAIGGGRAPQRVEVASRAPDRTPPTSPRLPSTTAPSTTAVAPPPTAAPDTTAPAPPPEPLPQPVPRPLGSSPAPQGDTAVPGPVCPKNNTNPECGSLFWDPPAAANQPLTVNVSATATSTNPPGRDLTFTVRVVDPDHLVTDNCAQISYGDGAVDSRPCSPPDCPDAHGAWDPPPAVAGDQTFTYRHHYAEGSYQATFSFRTDKDGPCPSPYGSVGQNSLAV